MDLEQAFMDGISAAVLRKMNSLDWGYRLGQYSTHAGLVRRVNPPGPSDGGYRSGQYLAHAALAGGINPDPALWRTTEAASFIVSALGLKAAASGLESSAQKATLERQLDAQIAQVIDEECGTLYPHIHGPLPGLSPSGCALAAELALQSASLQAGELQKAVLVAATMALQRTVGAATSE